MNQENNDPSADDAHVAALRGDVDRTRMQLSETLQALDDKLNPQDLRDRAAIELENLERHIKAVLKEELSEAKVAVGEVIENARATIKEDAIALSATVKEDAIAVSASVKQDVIALKDSVKDDVKQAFADAKTSARAATFGKLEDFATQAGDIMNDSKDTLMDTLRQNPIPVTLVGVGLAWMLMNRSRSASQRRSTMGERGGRHDHLGQGTPRRSQSLPSGQHRIRELAHEASDAAGHALRKAKDATASTLEQAADDVGAFAHDMRGQAGDLAHRAADGASNLAHDAAEATSHLWNDASDAGERAYGRASATMSDIADEVPRQARRAERAAGAAYMDNPLAVGAVVLAAGALLGMALPRTDREDEFLGETRDQFLVNARQAAHGALETVHHMGEDAAQNVRGALAQSTEV